LNALICLKDLEAPDGLPAAQSYLSTTDLPIRDAAIAYVAKFAPQALTAAKAQLTSNDERVQRIGIEILSALGTSEALDLAAPYLSKGSMGLKIQALLALDGRCPQQARRDFLALRDDQNSIVKAVALGADPGR
jgi:hypothetical protein